MNRIKNLVALCQAAADAPESKFSDLPLGAQTKVVFSVYNRVHSGMQWWEKHVDDESNDSSFRARAVREVNQRAKAVPGLLDFINRASHYSSGKSEQVKHDASFVDEDGVALVDVEYTDRVVNGNPFAWAKAALVERGEWPEPFPHHDEPLPVELWEVSKTYDRYFARYMALSLLAELGIYAPPERKEDDGPSDIVLIASLSPLTVQFAKGGEKSVKLFMRQLTALINKSFSRTPLKVTTYVEGERVVQEFDAEQLIGFIKQAYELDVEDAEAAEEAAAEAETKAETKALCKDIRGIVRSAVMATTVMAEMTKAAATMKEAGVSQAVIDSMMSNIANKFAPQVAPAADELDDTVTATE